MTPLWSRSTPEERVAKRNERWLSSLDAELLGAGTELLAVLPRGWQVGGIDRERFASAAVTYGATAFAPGGPGGPVACGVATTRRGALEALVARLDGDLAPTDAWAPPVATLAEARRVGSVGDLEVAGWTVRVDGESYGIVHDGVRVTGAVAERDPDTWVLAVVSGRGRADAAIAVLDDVLAGRREPAERWAPA